jgi:hypothetical protein
VSNKYIKLIASPCLGKAFLANQMKFRTKS